MRPVDFYYVVLWQIKGHADKKADGVQWNPAWHLHWHPASVT